ncbi:MAG: response regulator [Mucinivorans sp.]
MQNELLPLIPDYLPLGIIVYDKDGRLSYINKIALGMFSPTTNVYGINIFDDPNLTTIEKEKLGRGEDLSIETDYDFDRCPDHFYGTSLVGTRKYFVTQITIMRSSEGEIQGYVLNCEDVTAKKAQEIELIKSYKEIKSTQKELSLALEAGNLTAWNYKISDGVFYKFNNEASIAEKWSFESIRDYVHPEDRIRFMTLIDAVVNKRQLMSNNIVMRITNDHGDGYCHYNFMYSIKEDDQGAVDTVTFIRRDITDDVKYQQNLISAKNKAEEADKLKSTFLATMSHEIRTPLNAIVGFSQLLSETDEPEEKKEYKQLIETNSDTLLKLIGDVLDLSKIEAGSVDIDRHSLDVSPLCDDLFQSFKQRTNNPNVTLRLVNPYSKCVVKLDRYRFIQILTNFMTNAIKYTPQGEIVMGYECTPNQVKVYVRDTGIGISDDKKDQVFGRFEKLDDFAQGTGLGLSICKAIADTTGGKIGFESKVNEGTYFWYIGYTEVEFVEKALTEGEPLEPQTEEQSARSEQLYEAKDLNILVAEDNDSNFLLIQTLLKNSMLTRATTGIEAVEMTKNKDFDAILMDIKMPKMDGLKATTLIRQFNTTVPIVALTANAFNADKDAAMAAGCNHFMTKPIKKDELMDVLSRFCV